MRKIHSAISRMKKNDWISIVPAATNIALVLLTWWLVKETQNTIVQSQKQYQELNRPFVTIEPTMKTNGLDILMVAKNVGNTVANDLTIFAYHYDSKKVKHTLISDVDKLDIGIIYPNEAKGFVIRYPGLHFNDMPDLTFTVELTYRFLDQCVQYSLSIKNTGTALLQSYSFTEKVKNCYD